MYARPGNMTRSGVRGVFDRLRADRMRGRDCLRLFAAQGGVLTLLQAASMVLAASALAQTNTCDEFKAVLAARIESSGVRGYSLETVKSGTPVPPDAKVIGTCESGARNVIYRRWGAARAAPASASAAEPASTARPTAVPIEPNRRVPGAPAERAVRPSPTSAPNTAPPPVSPSTQAALVAPAPVRAPEKTPTRRHGRSRSGPRRRPRCRAASAGQRRQCCAGQGPVGTTGLRGHRRKLAMARGAGAVDCRGTCLGLA